MSNISNNTERLQTILESLKDKAVGGGGTTLPTLINEGSAPDLMEGKELIDSQGKVVIGTLPTVTQATPSVTIDSNGLITANATQTAGYVVAGTKSTTKQLAFQPAKTITPTTTSQVAVSSGHYTGGDITVVGDENLKAENIKTGVSIFGVDGAYETNLQNKTITLNGTHTADDGYDGLGIVTVDVPTEMDYSVEDAFVTRTFSTYTNNRIKTIGSYAFTYHPKLTTASFPACTTIYENAFWYCRKLIATSFPVCTSIGNNAFSGCAAITTISFPACTFIGGAAFFDCYGITTASFPACTSMSTRAFGFCHNLATVNFPVCLSINTEAFINCTSLEIVNFPACTNIGGGAFSACYGLTTASFPACTSIGSRVFIGCSRLSKLYLVGSSVCNLSHSNTFQSTPFAGNSTYFSGTPYIYVPASLVEAYKIATNWTYFSKYISAVEDAPQE